MSCYDQRLVNLLQERYGFTEPDLRPQLRYYRPLPLPADCADPERVEAYDLYCAACDSLRLGRTALSAYRWHPRMHAVNRWLYALQGLMGLAFPEYPVLLTGCVHRSEWWALRAFCDDPPEAHRIDEERWIQLVHVFHHNAHDKHPDLPAYPALRDSTDFAWYPGGLRALALRCWPQRAGDWDALWRIGCAPDEDLPLLAMEELDFRCASYLARRLHGQFD